MDKTYQIFISSTYKDLAEERKDIKELILKLGHIPRGMEAFTANNQKKELIEKTIGSSDYFILIIGDTYGTICENGLSFTEIEYDYALKNKKPILPFIKVCTETGSSKEQEDQDKLNKFKEKVRLDNNVFMPWTDKNGLKESVNQSLYNQFQTNPQKGWIRHQSIYEDYPEVIKNFPTLGIKKLHYPCENMPFPENCFKNAKSVKLMFISGVRFMGAHSEKLIQALENNAEIKIILATKSSEYTKETRAIETMSSGFVWPFDTDVDIDRAMEGLKKLRSATSKGKILLKQSNTQIRANMVIVDDNFAFYTPHLHPKNSSKTLTLELENGKILEDCKEYFNTLYDVLCKRGKVKGHKRVYK